VVGEERWRTRSSRKAERRGGKRSIERSDLALDEKGREKVLISLGIVEREMTVPCSVSSLDQDAHQERGEEERTRHQSSNRNRISSNRFSLAFLRRRLEIPFGVEHLEADEDEVEHTG
jgi:hypothetical protein